MSLPTGTSHAKRDTRDLRLAETRIDLQRAIAQGMSTLSPQDQADMRRLMTGTVEGIQWPTDRGENDLVVVPSGV